MSKVLKGNIYTHIVREMINNSDVETLKSLSVIIMALKIKVFNERKEEDFFDNALTLMKLDKIQERVIKRINKIS